MIIKKVYIYNFLLFEEVDVELGEGVFFVTGENRDEPSSVSNGAGKSTFCNAIIWAFFDHLLKKSLKKDDVIGRLDEYAQVRVEFEDNDGRLIKVDRVRGHPERQNGVTIHIDGQDKTKHLDRDSNEYIEQLLISSKTVYHCAYSDASKEPLPALTSSQLNKVVAEIIDSSRFDEYIKKVRKQERAEESSLEVVSARIVDRMDQIENIESDIERFQKEIDNFESNRTQKIDELKAESTKIQDKIDELDEQVAKGDGLEEEISKLEPKVQDVDRLNAELRKDQKYLDQYKTKKATHAQKVVQIEGQITEQDSAYDNLFRNDTGECSYCGNLLKDSKKIADIAQEIEGRRDKLRAKIIDAEVKRDNAAKEIDQREDKIKEVEAKLDECREVVEEHNRLVRKLDGVKAVKKEAIHMRQRLESVLKDIERQRKATPDFLNKSLEESKERLDKAFESIRELNDKLEGAETSIEACGALQKAIKRTKAGLFNGFIMKLQDGINSNLQDMTDGDYHCRLTEHKGELNLTFINGMKEEYLSYHSFSQGERARISKACSIALNDLLDVGFLFDDEGLSGLDGQGAKDILDFIVSRGDNKSIFFVSHLTSVKDYLSSARNIHIVKENGTSTARVT